MTPEQESALLALVILTATGLLIYRLVLWLAAAVRTPDPWGQEVEEAVEREDAVPLCDHCLCPQEHNGWFCPNCGATVGRYSNYLPFVYPFSLGEGLRAAIEGRVPKRWLPRAGYLLIPFCFLPFVVAPIYLIFFWLNLSGDPRNKADISQA
jgi:hypothetical protein